MKSYSRPLRASPAHTRPQRGLGPWCTAAAGDGGGGGKVGGRGCTTVPTRTTVPDARRQFSVPWWGDATKKYIPTSIVGIHPKESNCNLKLPFMCHHVDSLLGTCARFSASGASMETSRVDATHRRRARGLLTPCGASRLSHYRLLQRYI